MSIMKKGITLVIALLILLILTLLGATIMIFSINSQHIGGNQMKRIHSLAFAKAGVSEAIRRLSVDTSDSLYIGDPNEPYNPDWRIFILLTSNLPADSPPVYYRNSVQMNLADSQRLNYTTENPDPNYSLVIHHKIKRNAPNEIYYYNWITKTEESHNPVTYTKEFFPIEVIEATGKDGNVRRKIKVEVARKSGTIDVSAAMSSKVNIEIAGNFICCGHNHLFNTPYGTNSGQNPFECFDDPEVSNDPIWHIIRDDALPHAIKNTGETTNNDSFYLKAESDPQCSATGCLPGISTPNHNVNLHKGAIIRGNPDWTNNPLVARFLYLYQILGASDWKELEAMYPWKSVSSETLSDTTITGFYRREGDLCLTGTIYFTGVLWVTGKLVQTGTLDVIGLIYPQDDIQLNGKVWVLGGIAIEGNSHTTIKPINGEGVLLYSSEAIRRAIALCSGYTIVSWNDE